MNPEMSFRFDSPSRIVHHLLREEGRERKEAGLRLQRNAMCALPREDNFDARRL